MLGLIIRILLFILVGFTINEMFALGSHEPVISSLVDAAGGAKAVQERLENYKIETGVIDIHQEKDFVQLLSQSKLTNRPLILCITSSQNLEKGAADKLTDMRTSLSKLAADQQTGQLLYAIMDITPGSSNAVVLDRILQSTDLAKDKITFPLTLTIVGQRLQLPINPGYLTYDYLRSIVLKFIGK